MLADFGAEVLKIEGLPHGDPTRRTGVDYIGDDSALFLHWNHGKKSVAIDLHSREGVEIALKLAETADVVVENYRPGVAAEIGIGYEDIAAINPRAIYCSVSAYGQEGPWAHRPGTDPIVQAMSGIMYVTGEADGIPVRPGVPLADFVSAMVCVQAVLLGLQAREHTGRGQRVDVSMVHSLLYGLTTRLSTYWATGKEPQRMGNAHSVVAPYDRFETSDGEIVAGAWGVDEASWVPFCEALGRPDLVTDGRFKDNALRVANRPELTTVLAAEFRKRTTAEWDARFDKAGALFGPVLPVSQALEHPQMSMIPTCTELEHPVHGPIRLPAPAHILMHETPGVVRLPPPVLGEHTIEILTGVGIDGETLEDLLARGVVKSWTKP
jgi:formyl-CoA transferase/CoA:oxalate CoA-transferase